MTLSAEETASFAKRSFSGRAGFDGSASATVNLSESSLHIVSASAEVIIPYDSIARSRLSKNSLGTIRIVMDSLEIFLNIEPTSDRLALFARLEEWVAGPV
jgi:hypothetical protein